MPRDPTDLAVLDAIADDVESYEHVAEVVGRYGVSNRGLLLAAVQRLVTGGLVEACVEEGGQDPGLRPVGERKWPSVPLTLLWLRMTPRGRVVFDTHMGSDGTV